MGKNKDKAPNIDSAVKGLSPGYKTDVYSKLDRLLFDKNTEFYAEVNDKYIRLALTTFLEDNNFQKRESDESIFVFMSAEEGYYKFTEDRPDAKVYDLPLDWDALITKLSSYLEDNPIDVEEIQEAFDAETIANIQEQLGIETETRIYMIDSENNRYYKGYTDVKGIEIMVRSYDNNIVFESDYDFNSEKEKETFLSRVTQDTIGTIYDKPMGRDNRIELTIYNSSENGLLKTKLDKEVEGLKDELEEKGYATLKDGRTIITDKEKMKESLKKLKEEEEEKKKNMIDADYLNDWSMENGEDVVMDGPFDINETQWETLGQNSLSRLEKEFNTPMDVQGYDPTNWYETVWETVNVKGLDHDKANGFIMEEMADLINKENIQKMW